MIIKDVGSVKIHGERHGEIMVGSRLVMTQIFLSMDVMVEIQA